MADLLARLAARLTDEVLEDIESESTPVGLEHDGTAVEKYQAQLAAQRQAILAALQPEVQQMEAEDAALATALKAYEARLEFLANLKLPVSENRDHAHGFAMGVGRALEALRPITARVKERP